MKNSELVNKFLLHRGFSKIQGESLLPVLPFLVMDVVYNMYNKTLRPIPAKHSLKKWKTIWEEAYNRFDRTFLAAFTSDEQDELMDKMDSLEDYISNARTVVEIQTMNCFPSAPIEKQKILACINVCNLLTHYAGQLWCAIYKNYDLSRDVRRKPDIQYYEIEGKIYKEKPNLNPELCAIEHASEELFKLFGGKNTSLQNSQKMNDSSLALVRKIFQWFKEN